MKRWFRTLVISIFALAALSLVVIQFVQTRRTFSISDNMFNVSVNNAMDEVVRQMSGEVFQTASHPDSATCPVYGGEYPFRGHGTPRRFSLPQLEPGGE